VQKNYHKNDFHSKLKEITKYSSQIKETTQQLPEIKNNRIPAINKVKQKIEVAIQKKLDILL